MLYVNPLEARIAGRLEAAPDTPERRKLAVQELEHLFMYTLLQEMRKTIHVGSHEKRPFQQELADEMMDDALSGEIAKSGQLGLARQIEAQLLVQAREVKSGRAAADSIMGPSPGR